MSHPPHHVVARLNARLGNQMFEYAFARTMALRLEAQQVQMYCHSQSLLDCFLLRDDVRFVHDLSNCSLLTRSASMLCGKVAYWLRAYPRLLYWFESFSQWWLNLCGVYFCLDGFITPNVALLRRHNPYLVGYFQSDRYFAQYRAEILRDFTFRTEVTVACAEWARCIQSNHSVCLHIRLGDYEHLSNRRICDQAYYQKAMSVILQQYPEAHFFIFSDSPERASTLLPASLPSTAIPPHVTPQQSLYLGSLCRHHIISNSSFSWWMQYLAHHENQIVIAPRRWMNDETPTPQFQSHWILV